MNTTKAVKKWEILPGKNRFFCDGRIVTGSQQSVFILTLFLVFGVTTLFFVFDSPYLARRLSLGIPIVAAVLFLFLLLFLFRTSWTDPGILPRALPDEAAYTDRLIERMVMNNDPPRMTEVVINGVPTKLKYCSTCKIFRPPRASHCSVCDNCVERFDHHCPWVGNCIGKRNYRYFYCFLVSVTIFCCYVLAFSVTTLVLRSLESDFVTAMKNSPGSIIEVVITFIALWSVVGLTGFHTFLASCNITTNEDIKNMYSKAGQKNPFSHDSLIKNYCEILCGPLSPSLIDRRGLVREECSAVPSRLFDHPSYASDAPVLNVTATAPSPKNQHINLSVKQHNFSSSAAAPHNHSSTLAAAQSSAETSLTSETPPTSTAVAVVALGRYGNSYNSAVVYPPTASRTDLTSVTISI